MDFAPVKFGLGTVWSLNLHGKAQDLARAAVISGGIYKQSGHFSKGWEKRFFVMCPVMLLLYFDDREDSDPRGVVVLTRDSTIQREPGFAGKDHVLEININPMMSDARKLHVAVDTPDEANDWCNAFYQNRVDIMKTAMEAGETVRQAAVEAARSAGEESKRVQEVLEADLAHANAVIAQLTESVLSLQRESQEIIATLRKTAEDARIRASKAAGEVAAVTGDAVKGVGAGAISGAKESLRIATETAAKSDDIRTTALIPATNDTLASSLGAVRDALRLAVGDAAGSCKAWSDADDILSVSHSELRTKFSELAAAAKKMAVTIETETEQHRTKEAGFKREEATLKERLQVSQSNLQFEKDRSTKMATEIASLQAKIQAAEQRAKDAETKAKAAQAAAAEAVESGKRAAAMRDATGAGAAKLTSLEMPATGAADAESTIYKTENSRSLPAGSPQSIDSRDTMTPHSSGKPGSPIDSTGRRPSMSSFLTPKPSSASLLDAEVTAGSGPQNGRLFVFVMGARHLPDVFGSFGSKSAYFKLRPLDQAEKAGHPVEAFDKGRGRGICAAFHQTAAFRSTQPMESTAIRLDVYAHRAFQKDIKIGTALLPCKTLEEWPGQPHAVWVLLHADEHVKPDAAEMLVPVKCNAVCTPGQGGGINVDLAGPGVLPPEDTGRYAMPELPPPPIDDTPCVLVQLVWVNSTGVKAAFHLPVVPDTPNLPSSRAAIVGHSNSFARPHSPIGTGRADANPSSGRTSPTTMQLPRSSFSAIKPDEAEVARLRKNLETVARAYKDLFRDKQAVDARVEELTKEHEKLKKALLDYVAAAKAKAHSS